MQRLNKNAYKFYQVSADLITKHFVRFELQCRREGAEARAIAKMGFRSEGVLPRSLPRNGSTHFATEALFQRHDHKHRPRGHTSIACFDRRTEPQAWVNSVTRRRKHQTKVPDVQAIPDRECPHDITEVRRPEFFAASHRTSRLAVSHMVAHTNPRTAWNSFGRRREARLARPRDLIG